MNILLKSAKFLIVIVIASAAAPQLWAQGMKDDMGMKDRMGMEKSKMPEKRHDDAHGWSHGAPGPGL